MTDSDIFRAILLAEKPSALIFGQALQLPVTRIARIAWRGDDLSLRGELVGRNCPIDDGFSYNARVVVGEVLTERCGRLVDTVGIDQRDASSIA